MKKISVFLLSAFVFPSFAFAQEEAPIQEPETQAEERFEDLLESAPDQMAEYDVNFTVSNISKDNGDATTTGAHMGDILLYELELQGKTAGMVEDIAINLSAMIDMVTIENAQNGAQMGDRVVYPDVSEGIDNWTRKYGLYVKVKDGEMETDSLRADFQGNYLTVSLLDKTEGCVSGSCDLTRSGPAQNWLFWGIIMGIIGLFGISFARR